VNPLLRCAWPLLASCLGACGGQATASLRSIDLDGGVHAPLAVACDAVHVLVFISQECPIANSYAPTLRDLAARWREQPVRLFLVHVDPGLSVRAAREHRDAFELPGTVLLDPEQSLARRLGVGRTPEAAVVTASTIAYLGRIDDQWSGLGARAQAAAQHDLADAVAAVLAGKPVRQPFPPAVGCLLPEPAKR
jgi:hypothetical protein